ncbi:MAG: pyridoxamine 5'-phosphate oxidase family protein [Oscillospiraceae bacterium]|nr:pyridoxamine 5'-phosphate oxidase family protein [Oscillospiraceae bacterium]
MFRELSRKQKQLSPEESIAILKQELRGVLSVLGDDDYPYGMPMNHWYDDRDCCIYFHCGIAGHRTDALARHNKVSFCVYDGGFREEGEWALHIRSVVVFGRMEILDDPDRIVDITARLSHKFTQDEAYIQSEIARYAKGTRLLRLTPEHICGKAVVES